MRPLLLFAFAGIAAAQQPDCQFSHTFSSAGNGPSVPNISSASGAACNTWIMSYTANGFSALHLHLQGAPDSNESAGTFADFTGTSVLLIGTNPLTSATNDFLVARAYFSWVRVSLDTTTGSGTVQVKLIGFKGAPAWGRSQGGGGGGSPGTPVNSVQFNHPLGTFAGSANNTYMDSGDGTPGLSVQVSDLATGASDSPARPVQVSHVTSGVPIEVDTGLVGFSAGYLWQMTNSDGALVPTMTLDTLWRDPTTGDNTVVVVGQAIISGVMSPVLFIDEWFSNIGVGFNSVNPSVVTGGSNSGFAGGTLHSLTTGVENSAFGRLSLGQVTSGGRNSAFGYGAVANSTGSDNTVVGANACSTNLLSGSNNTCLGSGAETAGDDSNEIAIGYNVSGNGSNTTTIGNSSTTDTYLAGIQHIGGTASASLNFPSIPDGTSADLTFTLTGAALGDRVAPGLPAVVTAAPGINCQMAVSATDTIQVRCLNLSGAAVDLASATFGATILK